MRTTMLCGGLVLAVLLASAPPLLAQSVVRGTVVDAKNQPVEGASVTFEGVDFVSKRDVTTDDKGEFILQGLTSGAYKVTAAKEGVGTETQTANVTQQFKLELSFQLVPAAAAAVAATRAAGPPALDALAAGATIPKEQAEETAAIQTLAASAQEAYRAEQYQESAARLNELVTKLPNCADCFMYLGNSYMQLKQLDEAEAALKKSVEIRPTVEGYTALTRLYNSQRKFDLAGEASQKASDLAAAPPAGAATVPGAAGAAAAPAPSASSETLYNQGVVFWNAGKYAEAKKQFEAAVKANPGNANAQYQLGMANLNLGEIPGARAAFEAYLKAEPNGDKAAQVKTFLEQLPK